MENEVACPFCKLSGISYEEMCFHIEAAHFEHSDLEGGSETIGATVPYGAPGDRALSVPRRMDVGASHLSAGGPHRARNSPHISPPDGALKHRALRSGSITECRSSRKRKETQCDLSTRGGTTYSPPDCPFCGKTEDDGQDMETHVKTNHAALLDAPVGGRGQLYDCPMCGLLCASVHILQEHVDLHLEESSFGQGVAGGPCSRDLQLARQLQEEEDRKRRSEESRQEREGFQRLQRQYGLDNSGGYKQQQLRNMELEVTRGRMHPSEFHRRKADMMESLARGIDDGKTRTSGIMEALHRYYQSAAPDVRRVWLSAELDHFHSSLGDKGWGCGYRNFQMLLSALLRHDAYADCLQGLSVPCIPKIQSLIEDAWKEGFDPQGACQLNNKLQGTKAWIGACEVYTLLTALRVKCRIVDFHKPTGPMGTHPRLFEWVLSYYSSEREGTPRVVCTFKPPLYLQHQGHSRTVVGIEERKNRTLCLLIFDPGCPSREMQKLLKADVETSSIRQLRKCVGNLKHKQYQIVAVEGVLSPEEKAARRQASQVFTSEKVP